MGIVYLHRELEEEVIRRGHKVKEFVNQAVKEELKKEEKQKDGK